MGVCRALCVCVAAHIKARTWNHGWRATPLAGSCGSFRAQPWPGLVAAQLSLEAKGPHSWLSMQAATADSTSRPPLVMVGREGAQKQKAAADAAVAAVDGGQGAAAW
eukprot:scaffold182686_cov18-Tisochrysis_lutea.AAC.1